MRYLIILCLVMNILVPEMVGEDENSLDFSIESGNLNEGAAVVRVVEG